MLSQDFSLSKTLNPSLSLSTLKLSSLPSLTHHFHSKSRTVKITSLSQFPNPKNPISRCDNVLPFAGRSKKKSGDGGVGGGSPGRIEGNSEFRRKVKDGARRRSKKYAESLFYRLKNPNKKYADNFTEEELQMIGLGYDRMVRFMEKDDPNVRHPFDWYKYGHYGPYSWRGVVIGDPIRGRFSDECVSMMGDVGGQDEWDGIEQHEMGVDFQKRMSELDKNVGFRYYWVFVRHPRWRVSDLPWEQWSLVSEVVVESGKGQRLDKWNLMARLGNKARRCIVKCAAWFRPDIIYVKKPVFQCRFEPQDDFFKALTPCLDPATEDNYLCELKREDGTVESCTYFGGLCKLLRVNPTSYVDDVVNAFEKLSDEKKSNCLEFLLTNHPVLLLHPFTKEWKAKLEEMELGCDAPDDDEDGSILNSSDNEIVDWIEDDGDDEARDDDDDDYNDEEILDMEEDGNDQSETEEEDKSPEEDERYWDEQFKKALSSSEAMERLARKSVDISNERYKNQIRAMGGKEMASVTEDGDELALRGKRAKVSREEWRLAGYGPWRKRIKKSKIPPQLFLKSAVRPFTYRNLVKEIVLTRHAILDGEIGRKEK